MQVSASHFSNRNPGLSLSHTQDPFFLPSPLRLPVDEAERRVKEPAHLGQRPPLVDADEEVWGRSGLERHGNLLPISTGQSKSFMQSLNRQKQKNTTHFSIKRRQIAVFLIIIALKRLGISGEIIFFP